MFEVISFGSSFSILSEKYGRKNIINGFTYSDENVSFACKEVGDFSANLGGTEIYDPL